MDNQVAMKKIIGKFFVVVLFLSVTVGLYAQYAQLTVTNLDGNPCKQVYVGIPFVVSLYVEGGANDDKQPEILGLQRFNWQFEGTSSTISTVRGFMKVDRTYRYRVRIDKAGDYILGPAHLKTQGDTIESNVVKIHVSAEPPQQAPDALVTCSMSVDKQQVYKGERIQLAVRILCPADAAQVEISRPELPDFLVDNIEGPISNLQHDDETKRYYAWKFTLYAKREGALIVPAVSAVAQVPLAQHNDLFSRFFGAAYEKKIVYSNAVEVDVIPLPAYNSAIDGVGQFAKFLASVNKYTLHVGDAVSLQMQVEGDGNLNEALKTIQLPSGLRSYMSEQSYKPGREDMRIKTQEFIIQPLEPGQFTLPEQKFTYFDTKKHRYKTLRTKPIVLDVIPAPLQQSSVLPVLLDKNRLGPLWENGQWYATPQSCLPWPLFVLFLLAPFGFFALRRAYLRYQGSRRKRYALMRSKLAQAQRDHDVAQLYPLFLMVIAQSMGKQETEITIQDMLCTVQEAGFTQDELKAWQLFVAEIMQAAFGGKITETNDQLFQDADYWLQEFEKKL